MKTYGEVKVQLHHSGPQLDGGKWWASSPSSLTLRERAPVPIGLETGWLQEQVWTLWNKAKAFCALSEKAQIMKLLNTKSFPKYRVIFNVLLQ